MTTTPDLQPTEAPVVTDAIAALARGSESLPGADLAERIELLGQIQKLLLEHAGEWVDICCRFKSLQTSSQRSEEILAGPSTTARYLTLLIQSLRAISSNGSPTLPGRTSALADGRLIVPVFPARGVYDALLFTGLAADVWMQPGVSREDLHGNLLDPLLDPPSPAPTALVLGAGNVAAIPLTDSLAKLFQESQVVLLKMNPVNEALLDVFRKILAPVIERDWLQIIPGGADVGQAAMHQEQVATVHITGSHHTHDRIVWGPTPEQRQQRQQDNHPLLEKPITSELGNVSPWIIVPGDYSRKQLRHQATNIAASLVNNAGFNCVTTRVLVTWREWKQRELFLGELNAALGQVPQRVPYYPGTCERFEQFTGQVPEQGENGSLAWLLVEDADPEEVPLMFSDESFVPASAEYRLDAGSPEEFLSRAAEFCNEELFGTLSAAITMPNAFRRKQQPLLERTISELNYGSVCINQWPGLVYGLMTAPWGAAPGSTLSNIQSGIGSVHNLYFLDRFEKTVFRGPLCNFPKPIWFPSHKRAEKIAWKLLRFYGRPAAARLPGLFIPALLG